YGSDDERRRPPAQRREGGVEGRASGGRGRETTDQEPHSGFDGDSAALCRCRARHQRTAASTARTTSASTSTRGVARPATASWSHACALVGSSAGAGIRPFVAQNSTPTVAMRTPVITDVLGGSPRTT